MYTRCSSVCLPSFKQASHRDVIGDVPEHTIVKRYLDVTFNRTHSQTCSYVAVRCHQRKNER